MLFKRLVRRTTYFLSCYCQGNIDFLEAERPCGSSRMSISKLESHTDSWPSDAFLGPASFASARDVLSIVGYLY